MYQSIFVAGHRGMVGSAVCRRLSQIPGVRLITRTRDEVDLEDESAVRELFRVEKPDAVIFAAARVGGIEANRRYPVEFMTENLRAQLATIQAAYESGVGRFLFLGSTCIYPRMAPQPIREEALLSGPLEPTNEAYALAKICGLKLCQYYRQQYGVVFHSAMPTNLYGPGDNYHPEHSHVLPGLLRRIHEAKESGADHVTIWGSGTPRREFLYVDDLADALVHLLELDDPPDWVNVGSGVDLSILELAELIAEIVGYRGAIRTDPSRPDGMPRKLTDISLLRSLGWQPRIELEEGIRRTYADFQRSLQAGLLRSA
ncbi:MAG: GDP-L-fucose synthase [Planctomycetota bacterium]|nr:MAG: GDP-L-fucose synthase [Planctomycetota bacterium]